MAGVDRVEQMCYSCEAYSVTRATARQYIRWLWSGQDRAPLRGDATGWLTIEGSDTSSARCLLPFCVVWKGARSVEKVVLAGSMLVGFFVWAVGRLVSAVVEWRRG